MSHGQSSGGVIALQIAAFESAAKLYSGGDKVAPMTTLAATVVGDAATSEVQAQFHADYLAGWIEDADAVFQNDLPALRG